MKRRNPNHFLNRELSWLEFNRRVLEEARDSKNPLLERLRFLCIFHSNLDEFFMVRVASLMRQIHEGQQKPDPAGLSPREQLRQVMTKVKELHQEFTTLYSRLLASLAREKIRILALDELNDSQCRHIEEHFENEVYPVLTPIALRADRAVPHLPGLAVILAVLSQSEAEPENESRLAIVQVPARLPGLCMLPTDSGVACCWLSDVVRHGMPRLFPGNRILEVAAFRVTRDSEVELDDEGSEDYVHMLESGLRKRQRAKPVRVEYERQMSAQLKMRIRDLFRISGAEALLSTIPLDPRALLAIVDLAGFDKLRYRSQPPLMPAASGEDRGLLEIIRERDILLHHPYDSFDPIVEFLEDAADDPDVLAIKQTLYRTSGKTSPIVRALVRAAESGKQVTVLFELTARFDEERNIHWARDMEEAGAHVLYGIAGLKVHAKITLVVRHEPDGIRRYVHLGTGNYNERTARVYTDFGLLTAAEEIGREASAIFNTMTGYSEVPALGQLVMAPMGLRERILSLIRREADWSRSGQKSGILAKMNSLVDPRIIEELCNASRAGVPIRLNVRGICCLRPGIPDLSENIRVVSILDRFLEHSRAFVFHNGGSPEVYLSSADWMPRNLDRRVELLFPITQADNKQTVIEALEAQFLDNQKARLLHPDGSYERITCAGAEPYRAQEALYQMALSRREGMRAVAPVRFTPIEGGK